MHKFVSMGEIDTMEELIESIKAEYGLKYSLGNVKANTGFQNSRETTAFKKLNSNLSSKIYDSLDSKNQRFINDHRNCRQFAGNKLFQANPIKGETPQETPQSLMMKLEAYTATRGIGRLSGYEDGLPRSINFRVQSMERLDHRRQRLQQLMKVESELINQREVTYYPFLRR